MSKRRQRPKTGDENEWRRYLIGGLKPLKLSLPKLKKLVAAMELRACGRKITLVVQPMIEGEPDLIHVADGEAIGRWRVDKEGKWWVNV